MDRCDLQRLTKEELIDLVLLMANDRLDGNDIQLTHEFLSMRLGIRRPGVTAALHTLEGLLAIKSIRGHVIVRDRSLLEKIAGDCDGMPESELTNVGLAPNNTAR